MSWEISTTNSDTPQTAYTIKNRPRSQHNTLSSFKTFSKQSSSANKSKFAPPQDSKPYCKYHKSHGHSTENCRVLKAKQEARTVDH